MDGIFGWLGPTLDPLEMLERMRCGANAPSSNTFQVHFGEKFGLGVSTRFDRGAVGRQETPAVAVYGHPRFLDPAMAQLAGSHDVAAAVGDGWRRFGLGLPNQLSGAFAIIVIDPQAEKLFIAVDRVGIERLCYASASGQIVVGTSAQSVAAHAAVGGKVLPQAIYNYFYFHTVPSPATIYQGIRKLQPAEFLFYDRGELTQAFYWQADYTTHPTNEVSGLAHTFRSVLDDSVKDAMSERENAAFLSGGTDSSTVVGVMSKHQTHPVHTFSIGFEAAGYDEMEFARCAGERFGSHMHEYYLKPGDIVTAIPIIARCYDEPFGNASAVPTYWCAKLASDAGFRQISAGDGGD
ncbi:MAG: asparagine synthetase B family protein, partial [Gammaproteobacteria bacterium]